MADLVQGQGCLIAVRVGLPHGDVKPAFAQGRLVPVNGINEFLPADMGLPNVGADEGLSLHFKGEREPESDNIPPEKQAVPAGGGVLSQI